MASDLIRLTAGAIGREGEAMGRYVVILEVRDTQGSAVPNDLKKQVLLDTENGEEVRRFVQRLLKPIYDGEFDDHAP